MRRFIVFLGLVAFPLLLWKAAAHITPSYLVADPIEVFNLIAESRSQFTTDFLITAAEAVSGLALAFAATFSLALFIQLKPSTEAFVMPYAIALKSVPIVAIAPLLVLWFGNGILGKVILASLICFFPLLVGFSDGLKSVPKELQYLVSIWSTSRLRNIWYLEIPFALPYLFSALKVAAPLAVVGAVVAEFSGADKGLGHATLVAAYRADTVLLFASILLVSALGLGFYLIISLIEKFFLSSMRVTRVFGSI